MQVRGDGATRLGGRAHRRAAARSAATASAPGRDDRRRQGLQGLPGASRVRSAGHAAALLAGLGDPGRPAALVRLPRSAAGAGAGPSEGLLVGLAAARPADRCVRSSAEPRRRSTTGSATRDWRGRASFFRDGYNFRSARRTSITPRAMGALLGGAMIGCGRMPWPTAAMAWRRCRCASGVSSTAARRRCSTTTICRSRSARQKMFADFAPTPIDRLMGRILVDRTMEMLITVYHSRLRRFVSSSGRARIAGRPGRAGRHLRRPAHRLEGRRAELSRPPASTRTPQGMPVWGYDFPPGRVAIQTPAVAVGAVLGGAA